MNWIPQHKPGEYTGAAKAFWKSENGQFGIFAMAADHRGEYPDYFWVGKLNGEPVTPDSGVSEWLPDAATLDEAKQLAEGYLRANP